MLGLAYLFIFPFNWPVFFHQDAYVLVKKKVVLSREVKPDRPHPLPPSPHLPLYHVVCPSPPSSLFFFSPLVSFIFADASSKLH